jgi:hypothetical protein
MGFGIFRKYKKGQRKMIMSFKDSDRSPTAKLAHERSLNQSFGTFKVMPPRQNMPSAMPQALIGANGHGIRNGLRPQGL